MPDLGRTTTQDPHAENYYSWSSYHYAANNPMLVTDPTGMDWFVNNETGEVLFLNGVSQFDNQHQEQYGNSWDWFGANDLFDTKDYSFSENSPVEYRSAEFGEKLMNEHGFEKASRQLVEEKTEVTQDYDSGGKMETSHTSKKILDSKVTYAKPDEMNKKEYVKKPDVNDVFMFESFSDVYVEKVPYEKRNQNETTRSTSAKGSLRNEFIERLRKMLFKK